MKSTSIEAHNSIKPEKQIIFAKIISGLKSIKKGSFRDIARASKLRDAQVWRRLSELKDLGKITESGTKVCGTSGRTVTVWKLIEE
ncbi:hypothetical protein [Salinimicrobium sp. GXAS 041]|uniref:hypothetical protein n=1 Tax=Salinimicrobium sp. GXAS 041 TaxID=3400806 RepID=UPI003C78A1BD